MTTDITPGRRAILTIFGVSMLTFACDSATAPVAPRAIRPGTLLDRGSSEHGAEFGDGRRTFIIFDRSFDNSCEVISSSPSDGFTRTNPDGSVFVQTSTHDASITVRLLSPVAGFWQGFGNATWTIHPNGQRTFHASALGTRYSPEIGPIGSETFRITCSQIQRPDGSVIQQRIDVEGVT